MLESWADLSLEPFQKRWWRFWLTSSFCWFAELCLLRSWSGRTSLAQSSAETTVTNDKREMVHCSFIRLQTWRILSRAAAPLRAPHEARYWRSVTLWKASGFTVASSQLCSCVCADYGERPLPLPLEPHAGNPYEPNLEEEYYWQGRQEHLIGSLCHGNVTSVRNDEDSPKSASKCWNSHLKKTPQNKERFHTLHVDSIHF